MRLFLIRHGETPWTVARRYQGTTDVPLNPKGIQQAKAIARFLQSEHPTHLYTSTLQRAGRTAQIISRALRLKPAADPRLNEISFGKWEGAHYRLLAKSQNSEFLRWREGDLQKPPGGESLRSLERRIGKFFRALARRHPKETVAVVSHGGPIKMFLFHALKARCSSIWSFRIDPASVSLIEGTPRLFQIAWVNYTGHLRQGRFSKRTVPAFAARRHPEESRRRRNDEGSREVLRGLRLPAGRQGRSG